ncbi:MFS transporter [Kocuria sp. cx-116]|uniref:MFS transporter n=1 Tax=Kocuria sp. cx-116 TaxID=2771378 RepID=UPI001681DDB2|nr:MFS transporter [Kocuria sp. cx-116]MBD2761999.1 MFS transporter [Kocuria sp. cx-116]
MDIGVQPTYLDVLRLPHFLRVLVPAVIGKLSFAMVSLALLLLLQTASAGFAISGAVAGVFGVCNVVVAPLRARLVDKYGARRVLPSLGLGYAISLVGLVILVVGGTDSVWCLVLLGAASGVCAPPLGAVVRGVWVLLSPTGGHRARAYSLDAVIEELVFIIGPLLVGGLMLLPSGPVIAVIVAAAAGLIGTLGVAAGPTPEPVERTAHGFEWRNWVGPLRHVRFWPVLLVLAAVGLVLGAAELVSTVQGRAIGDAGPGVLVAGLAAGSAVGGLVYGSRNWKSSAVPRMVFLALCGLIVLLALAWISHFGLQLAAFVVMGLFVSPSLISGYLAADDVAPAEERTEASVLINTAVNAGAAVAIALGAVLLDDTAVGAAAAYLALGGGALVFFATATHALCGRTQATSMHG